MPPKMPAKVSAGQLRAWNITNAVVYSLASIYQHLGRPREFEAYAKQARERGLLPTVFKTMQKNP